MTTSNLRIALVHERFTENAGSEHVVEQFALQWPDAEVFAPITKADGIPDRIANTVHATWLNLGYRMLGQRSYAPLAPLIPRTFRRMNLRRFDVVVVSHHAFATQAVFATDAPVITYVHTPARWAWAPSMRAQEAGGRACAAALAALGRLARNGEMAAAPRLRHVIANSTAVARCAHDYSKKLMSPAVP